MNIVGKFEFVKFSQFCLDTNKNCKEGEYSQDYIETMYNELKKPVRATDKSAGYDFSLPESIVLKPHEEIVIPTGFKVRLEDGWCLKLYPRSGLGFKYQVRLANTIGIIDGDYYNNSDNEGHIMIKLVNGPKLLELNRGDRFAQSIFEPYGIVEDDEPNSFKRSGGLGSTGLK